MGSIATIALRKTDGEAHVTSGRAADISWLVNNIRLVREDPAHIERFLHWEDYEFHQRSDPKGLIAPQGSGLVVVDLASQKILSYHDVTAVGYFSGIIVTQDAEDLAIRLGGRPTDENLRKAYLLTGEGSDDQDCVRFREFLDADRVKTVYNKHNPGVTLLLRDKPIEQVHALLEQGPYRCELDMSPFEVSRYEASTVQGAVDMQKKLGELGFDLNKVEIKAWQDWTDMLKKR